MSARQVEAAAKQVRAEMLSEVDEEHRLHKETKKLADESTSRPVELPDEVTASMLEKDALIERQKQELVRLAETGRQTIEEANRLRRQNGELQRDVDEAAELLRETQDECNRVQAELLNLQSAVAKGDAERMPSDELTVDVFASAVRQFIGVCARVPHMNRAFAVMNLTERNSFDELLRTVEGWARDARNAMNTIACEEVEIHDA